MKKNLGVMSKDKETKTKRKNIRQKLNSKKSVESQNTQDTVNN